MAGVLILEGEGEEKSVKKGRKVVKMPEVCSWRRVGERRTWAINAGRYPPLKSEHQKETWMFKKKSFMEWMRAASKDHLPRVGTRLASEKSLLCVEEAYGKSERLKEKGEKRLGAPVPEGRGWIYSKQL